MTAKHRKKGHTKQAQQARRPGTRRTALVIGGGIGLLAAVMFLLKEPAPPGNMSGGGHTPPLARTEWSEPWIRRAFAVTDLFHRVYTPCWEGAYGALGDAYLFAATGDSSLLLFHTVDHSLVGMCEGTWVDDRAWVCLAELAWWNVSGRTHTAFVSDAVRRYDDARREGRFSSHEGFWSWYNWPHHQGVQERVFTNSNMNQMVTVACRLYEATRDKRFLDDALLAWNGDGRTPGIEKTYYRGNGQWEAGAGPAAFGHALPWRGTGYCSVASALYAVTQDEHYRAVAIATARRMTDPANGWVAPDDYYQIHMDGNGAFVHYLLDAYAIAPDSLSGLLPKIGAMLDHVWSNHQGTATVQLHRESDNGIRNGWNPRGGEDGYGVGEVGTVHAQGEAARAFGVYAYFRSAVEGHLHHAITP